MTEQEGFIAAILADPQDDATRLVYADWLEDRGDARGEYLRLEFALASAAPRSRKARELRARLQEVRARLKPSWLFVFDQPGVLRANPTPFPAGWWSVDLEGYREAAGTYGLFPYDSLPPLPAGLFRGDFRWLRRGRRAAAKPKPTKKVERLAGAAAALGIKLPREYGVLMSSAALRRRVRSCTDCFFNWPITVVESPAGEGGYLVRFYSDSQGCLHWYLYLTDRGCSCVVASGGFFGGDEWDTELGVEPDDPSAAFWFCAPSLEEFVYRTWIENEIWFALSDDDHPLTPQEEAYLNHYRRE